MREIKFFIPNPGDTVPVRLHTGEVVDAKYVMESPSCQKVHVVDIGVGAHGSWRWTTTKPTNRLEVRFVAPSCDLVPS